MSNQDPGTETQDFAVPTERKPGGTRRFVAAFAAAALAAVGVGAAVWAWQSFMDQGAQPAEALPANTLAYAALDLDPPGGQKVEAFKTLQRFPSIKRELGLGSVDDVQRGVVKELTSDTGCRMGYSSVKDWLGDRLAVAVVAQKKPEAVLVLQVSDLDKARAELKSSSGDCGFGYAFHGDWAILARSSAVATQASHDASSGTLKDHADFTRLTKAAGGAGLVTLYAAPEAGKALLDVIDNDPFSGLTALQLINGALDPMSSFVTTFGVLAVAQPTYEASSSVSGSANSFEPDLTAAQKKEEAELNAKFEHFEELTKAQQEALMKEQDAFMQDAYGMPSDAGPGDISDSGSSSSSSDFSEDPGDFPTPKVDPDLRSSLEKFTGLGGVGRFADKGLEVEVVGGQLHGTSADLYDGKAGSDLVSALPKNSAIAFGAGLATGWVDTFFKQTSSGYVFGSDASPDTAIKAFEKSTGLDVPADLQALGGNGVSVVAGSGLSFDSVFDDPARTPVGARISGDPEKIEAAIAKLRAHHGSGSKLLSKRIGDDVVVTMDPDYLDELAASGSLADADAFKQVLPDADQATTVLFINFDAGNWLENSVSGSDRENAKPLHALGMSVTRSDGQQHVLLRLSFDD